MLCALALGPALASCRCEPNEQPYTPFGVASSRHVSTSGATPTATSVAPALATQEQSSALKPPAAKTVVEGVEVTAPEGALVAHVLPWVPGRSVLAWLVPASQAVARTREAGSLVLFESGQEPKPLAAQPSFVPTHPGCTHEVSFVRSGPSSVTIDVNARCEGVALPERAPTQSLQVVIPDRAVPVLQTLRLAPPNVGETLTASVNSADVDGDGHDDVAVTFAMTLEKDDEPVTAKLVWLNRAAGVARESAEPKQSFEEVGSVESVRAKGKNTRSAVARRVETARRLIAFLCAEGGNPRMTDAEGRGIDCGALGLARDRFALAEVEAHLRGGQVGDAVLAFDLLPWYGGVSEGMRKKLVERIGVETPTRTVQMTSVPLRPRDSGPAGALSPLAFAADDSLLIQTTEGIRRWRNGESSDATEEVDPWRLVVEGPAGETWLGASLPCEKPLVELQARAKDGAFLRLLQGRWLAPRPSVCNGASAAIPEVRPVRWDATGIGVLFGSAWLGSERSLDAPWLGSPVSANGQHWVSPTSLGLFVQHEASSELWSTRGAPELRSCVIDNRGERVACVNEARVVVLGGDATPEVAPSSAP